MLQSSICCRIFLPILSSLLPSSLCFYYVDVNRSTGQDYPDNILLMFGCLHWIFYQIFFHTGSHLYQYFDQFPHHSKPCLKELQFGWQSNRGLISLWHFPIGWLKTTLTQIQQSLPKFQLNALSHEAIFSCNLQRNGISSCLLQEKSPPVTLLVCKIIRLQVIQQFAYVYNPTGACNIFFTQICVASCKKKFPRVTAALVSFCWSPALRQILK